MKKTLLGMLLALVMAFVMAFAGCGIGQGDADKINEKAEADKHYTYEELMDKYGKPVVDLTASGFGVEETGLVVWVDGCESMEDVEEKWENEETLKALSVTFADGKATGASYDDNYTEEDK